MKGMSVGKQRRNIATGLRVKVRFVTKSNKRGKDGKPLRRLKWYGGVVTDVATSGKRIKIKYDDGTSEVADFPDKDIVVDDEDNRRHRLGVPADAFIPPPPQSPSPSPERRPPVPRSRSRSRSRSPSRSPVEHNDKSRQQQPPVALRSRTPPPGEPLEQRQSPQREEDEEGENGRVTSSPPLAASISAMERTAAAPVSEGRHSPPMPPELALTHPSHHRQLPGSTKAVSESPFSPVHEPPPHLGLGDSSSGSTVSVGNGSFDVADASDAAERVGPISQQGVKRGKSPVPSLISKAPVEARAVEKTAGEARKCVPVSDKPNLHIKLIPPKMKKAGKVKGFGGSSDKFCVKIDDDAGYMPSDGEEFDSKRDRDRGKSVLSQDGEEEWSDTMTGKSKLLSGKKRGSAGQLDSGDEPPKKRPMAITSLKETVVGGHEEITVAMHVSERKSSTKPRPADGASELRRTQLFPEESDKTSSSDGEAPKKKKSNNIPIRLPDARRLKPPLSPKAVRLGRPEKGQQPSASSEGPPKKSKKRRLREEKERLKGLCRDSEQRSPKVRRGGSDSGNDVVGRRGSGGSHSSRSAAGSSPRSADSSNSRDEKESSSDSGSEKVVMSGVAGDLAPVSNFPAHLSHDGRGAEDSVQSQRSGRRAAKKANERIKERKELVIKDEFIKPKKKKAIDNLKLFSAPSDVPEDEDGGEDRWVQCDRCEKWRLLPSSVEMDKLPERWFCELNIYDRKRNSCGAPEQTAQQVEIEKRKRREAKKSLAARAAQEERMKTEDDDASAILSRDSSQAPPARLPLHMSEQHEENQAHGYARNERNEAAKSEALSIPSVQENTGEVFRHQLAPHERDASSFSLSQSESVDGPQNEMPQKPFGTGRRVRSSDDMSDGLSDSASLTKPKGSSRKRNKHRESDRERSNRDRDSDRDRDKSSKGGKDKDKKEAERQEWVQCDKCEKWRRLPPRISPEDLPDSWYCSMNTWDPRTASCEAPEDKLDSNQREYTVFGGPASVGNGIAPSFGTSTGKLSYRNLIFGNGKKHHRPASERTCAAESLFPAVPSLDPMGGEGCSGPPTVMYANSSAFVGRGMSTQRSGQMEESNKRTSFLDLMSNSELWAELYRGAQAIQALSAGCSSYPEPAVNGTSNESFLTSMKGLAYRALGRNTLAGHEVLLEAQCRQWDDAQWAQLRSACTLENVTCALNELVKEGKVEIVPGKNKDSMGVDSTCYRRAQSSGNEVAAVKSAKNKAHVKGSRCMKISKPWKKARATVEDQWCS